MRRKGKAGGKRKSRGNARRPAHARATMLSDPAPLVRTQMLEQIIAAVLEFSARIGISQAEARRALRRAKFGSPGSLQSARYLRLQAYSDLVRAWFSEVPYLDHSGSPRALAINDGREFAGLVRRFVPDDSPDAAADTLSALGAIARMPDGRLRPQRRALLMPAFSAASLERVPVVLRGILSTIAHNLGRSRRGFTGRIERTAITGRLPRELVPAFDTHMRKLAHVFIEQADAWMMKREAGASSVPGGRRAGRKAVRAGVSVFAYLEPLEGTNGPSTPRQRRRARRA